MPGGQEQRLVKLALLIEDLGEVERQSEEARQGLRRQLETLERLALTRVEIEHRITGLLAEGDG